MCGNDEGEMGWNNVLWDGVRWKGIGWDGTWNGTGWVEMGRDEVVLNSALWDRVVVLVEWD